MRRLVICSTCKFSLESKTAPDGETGGQKMIAAMHGYLAEVERSDIEIEEQACLWNCTRPCSVIAQDDERYSYVTGGNEPTRAQVEAIVQWFDEHGKTSDGQVPFRLWPQLMRGHFIARIPPLSK